MTQLANQFYAWRAVLNGTPDTVHIATHIPGWKGDYQQILTACGLAWLGLTVANHEGASGTPADARPVNCAGCRDAIVEAALTLSALLEGRE